MKTRNHPSGEQARSQHRLLSCVRSTPKTLRLIGPIRPGDALEQRAIAKSSSALKRVNRIVQFVHNVGSRYAAVAVHRSPMITLRAATRSTASLRALQWDSSTKVFNSPYICDIMGERPVKRRYSSRLNTQLLYY